MKERILFVFNQYISSYNVEDGGFSRKKLIAQLLVIATLVGEGKYFWKTADFHYLMELVLTNMGFVTVLLGITSYEKLQIRKMGNSPVEKPEGEAAVKTS